MRVLLVPSVIAALVPGCQLVLGREPFEGADPREPGCATGWKARAPIGVFNESAATLHDFQVPIHVDTQALIAQQQLQPSGADLRFTLADGGLPLPHVIESGLGSADTLVWVRVPELPLGISELALVVANPNAPPLDARPVFVDVIANSSFEQLGGWTIDPPSGAPAGFTFGTRDWATDGEGSLLADLNESGDRLSSSTSSISQSVAFPAGSSYVIRFDIHIIAASHGGVDFANDGHFALTLGNGINNLWALGGDAGNITGIRRGLETDPFTAGTVTLRFELGVAPGNGAAYAKAYLDNLRVRRQVSPAPVTHVGEVAPTCRDR